jgi:hypothetical protein
MEKRPRRSWRRVLQGEPAGLGVRRAFPPTTLETQPMLSISKLFAALNTLAENVLALAQTTEQLNTALRTRLALDAPETPTTDVIDHVPENGGGRRKRASA